MRTGIILLVLLGAVPEVQDAAAHPVALAALPVARAATWWRRLSADAAGAVVFLVGGIAGGLRRASAAGARPRRRR